MFKFRVLVQNKRAKNGIYRFRNGYIRAMSESEAIQNLQTVFSGFDYEIDYVKPVLYVAA
ncbi:hypothetical protein ACFHWD_03780 [Clostridium sp. MT-14]|uniref:hypothetical protein n=1 Tax=Clostridium sp. MT-14 TaxID=3348360 RepID=UPI0035F38290